MTSGNGNDQTKIHHLPGFDAPPLTDAQLCATWGAQALSEGRYSLGEALAQLARRADQKTTELAHRAAQREVTGAGPRNTGPMADVPSAPAPRDVVCAHMYEEHGSRRICGAVVIWHQGGNGVLPGWYHADPEITDHVPVQG